MPAEPDPAGLDPAAERRLAVALFNRTWTLLERMDRSRDEDDAMLHMAHASRHHWGQVGEPVHRARGEWQVSRVYAVLGRPEPSRHHAQRVVDLCLEHGIADWDLAYGYEALARAEAVSGSPEQARAWTQRALDVPIAEHDDREHLLEDLATVPGQAPFW
ncbi:MAG: hypothetical protein ACTHMS_21185 [Jatrophihabitans sp.]|uniref:hypothetical protein n=1 Tax=Jatrophihabitans sp. TaxID=1932789 RepID=UPI003F7D02AF